MKMAHRRKCQVSFPTNRNVRTQRGNPFEMMRLLDLCFVSVRNVCSVLLIELFSPLTGEASCGGSYLFNMLLKVVDKCTTGPTGLQFSRVYIILVEFL